MLLGSRSGNPLSGTFDVVCPTWDDGSVWLCWVVFRFSIDILLFVLDEGMLLMAKMVQWLMYVEENAIQKTTATSKFGVNSWTLFSIPSIVREFHGDLGKISREIPLSQELLDSATVSVVGADFVNTELTRCLRILIVTSCDILLRTSICSSRFYFSLS